MNRIAIFLRKELTINRFSDAVLGALNCADVDRALVCSGFFQEDTNPARALYSVSDRKYDLVARAKAPITLDFVGYYGWQRQAYADFITGVKTKNRRRGVAVNAYRVKGDKWHAKICIAKNGNTPIFAAIGSSNMTRRAFDNIKNFNYECDVIMWEEKNTSINSIVEGIISDSADEFPSVVVAKYDKKHPANRVPLPRRLLKLDEEIRERMVSLDLETADD
ncbi:phospholipase D-like domain-containing protein [Rhizobium leguminosarum]|uniref:phospholipase D-like domain-containing protein n=1 Tax=Rhizobium leguminosarum TaxID=384 RepID=UPI003F995867